MSRDFTTINECGGSSACCYAPTPLCCSKRRIQAKNQLELLPRARVHGFFGLTKKSRKTHRARVCNVPRRLFGRRVDNPSSNIVLWRQISGVREQTLSAAGPRRPKVASTGSDAAPAPPAPSAPTAPGNRRKSAGERAAPCHPPEWRPSPRRPSRRAAPSFWWKRPSPRRGP